VIAAAKERVPVINLADRRVGPGQMRRICERWSALCPLPDHDEKTPSFVVYEGRPGLVVLWLSSGRRGRSEPRAAGVANGRGRRCRREVLLTFGHEIPPRPESWFARQERQAPMRRRIEDVRTEVLMRRPLSLHIRADVAAIDDPDERAEMAAELWRDVLPLAARLVPNRRRAE
jgi:hypothetical protein